MALNSLIPLMVKNTPIDIPNLDAQRLQRAHADLYEGQAQRARAQGQQQAQLMDVLRRTGGAMTPEAIGEVMQVDPGRGIQMRNAATAAATDARKAEGDKFELERKQHDANAAKFRRAAAQLELVKTPEQLKIALNNAVKSGDMDAAEADGLLSQPFEQFVAQQPFMLRRGEEAIKAKEAEIKAAVEGRAAAIAPAQLQIAQNSALTGKPNAAGLTPAQQLQTDDRIADNARAASAATETGRHNRAMEARPGVQVQQGAQLSPEAIAMLAQSVAGGGTLPPLGRNAGATIGAVLNKAAQVAPGANLNVNKADLKGNQTALTALQKTQAQVNAFEETASKNIDVFLDAAKDIIDTGSPILNRPLRAAADAFGSKNMAAFNVARETALTEAAKVLESPGGNSALTVSGREAVKTLSNSSATLGQQIAAMRTIKNDMANRKKSQAHEIETLRANIANIGKSGGGDQSQVVEQFSKSRNEWRHSTDGGKTWQPGKAK